MPQTAYSTVSKSVEEGNIFFSIATGYGLDD
jgi:hypothetical protein